MNRVGWVFFLGLVICNGGVWLLSALSEAFFPRDAEWTPWLLQFIVVYAIFLPLCARLLPDAGVTAPPPRTRLSARQTLVLFIISLGMLYTVSMVTQILVEGLSSLLDVPINDPMEDLFEMHTLLPKLIFGCVLGPLAEEYLFRGLLLRYLRDYGDGLCMLASGLVFGLFHTNIHQIFYAFVLGALFAWMTRISGTLLYAIAFHMAINFIGVVAIPALYAYGGDTGALLANSFVLGCVLAGFLLFSFCVPSLRLAPGPLPLSGAQKVGLFFSRPGILAYMLACAALTAHLALVW